MSHHIDDIFKKTLGNASLEGVEEDWKKVQLQLHFRDNKKKRFFWIWGVLGLFIIISISGTYFMNKLINRNSAPFSQPQQENITTGVSDDVLISENAIVIEQLKNADLDENQLGKQNTGVNNKITPASSHEVITKIDDKNQRKELYSPNQLKSIINKENSENKGEKNTNLTEDPLTRENIMQDEIKTSNILSDEKNITSNNLANNKNVDLISSDENYAREILEMSRLSNLGNPVSTWNERNFKSELELLQMLAIEKFMTILDHPQMPNVVKLENEKGLQRSSPGIYLLYDPISNNVGGGLLVNRNLNSNWSINFGIGLRRQSDASMTSYNDVILSNRASASADLKSINTYESISLDIPIRILFHMNKHSLFIGGLVERPFYINGMQEVRVTQEIAMVDVSGDPLQAPTSFEPFSAVQEYNINAVPDRKKLFVYGQIGYGFTLTNNFNISIAGSYRLNSKTMISPLLSDNELILENETPWILELRMAYFFQNKR